MKKALLKESRIMAKKQRNKRQLDDATAHAGGHEVAGESVKPTERVRDEAGKPSAQSVSPPLGYPISLAEMERLRKMARTIDIPSTEHARDDPSAKSGDG
jgi:hypothetical protein